jgi:hypothetical protein
MSYQTGFGLDRFKKESNMSEKSSGSPVIGSMVPSDYDLQKYS